MLFNGLQISLEIIRCFLGGQCNLITTGEMCSRISVLITTRSACFWLVCSRVPGKPSRNVSPISNMDVTDAWTIVFVIYMVLV